MSASPPRVAVSRPAPFERPAGRRGMRGVLAGLVAVGAIPAMYLSHQPNGGSGSESGGGSGYSYTLGIGQASPPTAVALVAMALLLLGAAAVLWRAHSRWLIAAAAVATIAAAGGSVAIVRAANRQGIVSAAAVESVTVGTPRAEVLRRLGAPATTTDATPTGTGPLLGCLVYTLAGRPAPASAPVATFDPRTGPPPITPADARALLCFAHDRFALRMSG